MFNFIDIRRKNTYGTTSQRRVRWTGGHARNRGTVPQTLGFCRISRDLGLRLGLGRRPSYRRVGARGVNTPWLGRPRPPRGHPGAEEAGDADRLLHSCSANKWRCRPPCLLCSCCAPHCYAPHCAPQQPVRTQTCTSSRTTRCVSRIGHCNKTPTKA